MWFCDFFIYYLDDYYSACSYLQFPHFKFNVGEIVFLKLFSIHPLSPRPLATVMQLVPLVCAVLSPATVRPSIPSESYKHSSMLLATVMLSTNLPSPLPRRSSCKVGICWSVVSESQHHCHCSPPSSSETLVWIVLTLIAIIYTF